MFGLFLQQEAVAIRNIFYMWCISIAEEIRLRTVARDLDGINLI